MPGRSAAKGENALFGPAYRGWNTLLQLLVDHGANVNAVSKAGITPWRAASGQGDRLGGVLFNPRPRRCSSSSVRIRRSASLVWPRTSAGETQDEQEHLSGRCVACDCGDLR